MTNFIKNIIKFKYYLVFYLNTYTFQIGRDRVLLLIRIITYR